MTPSPPDSPAPRRRRQRSRSRSAGDAAGTNSHEPKAPAAKQPGELPFGAGIDAPQQQEAPPENPEAAERPKRRRRTGRAGGERADEAARSRPAKTAEQEESGRSLAKGLAGERASNRTRRSQRAAVPEGTTSFQSAPTGQPSEAPELERRAGILHYKGLKLSQFQLEAVRAVQDGHNVLVSAPTGAGKTLVAEYAIEDAVRAGRRCIYTAPIKALSNQKYRDFRDDPDIDVGLMTGDVTIHPSAQVLIMTTEILRNTIFEDPAKLHDVAYVIFDEVHYMDDPERGTVWEESLIFAPDSIRFICLSATIRNLTEMGRWLGEIRDHELKVVQSDKRPVPLDHWLFIEKVGPFPAAHLPRVRKRLAEESGRRKKRYDKKDWRKRRDEKAREESESFARLLDHLQEDNLLPALCFCFSRKDCERLAVANRKRQLLDEEQQERVHEFSHELLELFDLDPGELRGEVFRLAARGIGYHHAGMLPVHKEVVERMFTEGLLKLLFTTETFALGINMPARTAAFFGLRKFDGVSFDYLRTRDYMQMAGRAGRQGIDDKGRVISRLDARDLEEAPLDRLFSGKPEPVESRFRLSYSSILHLIDHLGRDRLHEAWEKSFNQFQHRGENRKARERNSRAQAALLDGHLKVLERFGYLEDDCLTPKGDLARKLVGYELLITECLWRGALETAGPDALAAVFVGLVFEERRRFGAPRLASRMFGDLRHELDSVGRELSMAEDQAGILHPMKTFDWGLTPAVVDWVRGASFRELERSTDATPGDVVRTLRMAVQLMRQTRRVVDPAFDLPGRLDEAIAAANRDEVDARRQLELG